VFTLDNNEFPWFSRLYVFIAHAFHLKTVSIASKKSFHSSDSFTESVLRSRVSRRRRSGKRPAPTFQTHGDAEHLIHRRGGGKRTRIHRGSGPEGVRTRGGPDQRGSGPEGVWGVIFTSPEPNPARLHIWPRPLINTRDALWFLNYYYFINSDIYSLTFFLWRSRKGFLIFGFVAFWKTIHVYI